MTLAPHRPPLEFGDLDEVAQAIRDRGCRLSSARRVLLEALFIAYGPVSAEFIADGMDGRIMRSDLSSVYRNLELFEELGVVRHVHLGHGPGLYALETGERSEYLVCERCNRVDTVDAARLDTVRAQVRERFGYQARFSHFPIVGLCAACSAQVQTGPDGGAHAGDAHDHGHAHTHGAYVHEHSHGHDAGADDGHTHTH